METNDVKFATAATAHKHLGCREGLQSVCNRAMPLDEVPATNCSLSLYPVIKPQSSAALWVTSSLVVTNLQLADSRQLGKCNGPGMARPHTQSSKFVLEIYSCK
jgi:hypothetical protein